MEADGLARRPEVGKALVDKKRTMTPVEASFSADKTLQPLNPGGVIYELLEGLARFVNLLQVEPVFGAVGMGLDAAPPLTSLQGGHLIQHGIQTGYCRC